MKRMILLEAIALLALAFCLACASSTEAQLGPPEGSNKAPEQFAASNYAVSGPYSHKNLTIFLLHGVDDSVVPIVQSETMAKALRERGRPHQFVKLAGEDHWLSRSETRVRVLQELEAFLGKFLSPSN